MSEKKVTTPVALAVGAALAGTFALGASANAEAGASPFAMTSLASGYMLGLGEGACGGDKEGKEKEGACGGDKEGEGACGGDKKEGEGACGGDKDKEGEGACGEGSCGGDAEDGEEGGEGA